MAWNKHCLNPHRIISSLSTSLALLALTGCSVMTERESPLREVTSGSPTVVDVYRGAAGKAAVARKPIPATTVAMPTQAVNSTAKVAPQAPRQATQPTTAATHQATAPTPQEQLRSASVARPVGQGDEQTHRYWSAVEPMQQRFARVPNPDMVMVVYPHLAKGKYPVPGYVTVFSMYEQVLYALPGEVPEDLNAGRALYNPENR